MIIGLLGNFFLENFNSFKTFLYEFGEIAQKNNLEVTKLTPLEILTSTNKNTSEKT